MTTVGAGKFTYTYIQDWAKLPAGQSLASVRGEVQRLSSGLARAVYESRRSSRKDPHGTDQLQGQKRRCAGARLLMATRLGWRYDPRNAPSLSSPSATSRSLTIA